MKQGFILTLDLAFGTIIIFILILAGIFFVSLSSKQHSSELQLARVGSDIVTVMEHKNLFLDPEHASLQSAMDSLLPSNIEMLLRLEGEFTSGNGTLEVGSELPRNKPIIAGQRVSLTSNEQYLKITYLIWPRREE